MKKRGRQIGRELLQLLDGVALFLTALVLSPLGIAVLALGTVVAAGFMLYWVLWEVPQIIRHSLRRSCPVHREKLDTERLTSKEAREDDMRRTISEQCDSEGLFRESELKRRFPHALPHWRLLSLGISSHYCRACRHGWNAYMRETLMEWHQARIASRRGDNLSAFSLDYVQNKARRDTEGTMLLLGFSAERINGPAHGADKMER